VFFIVVILENELGVVLNNIAVHRSFKISVPKCLVECSLFLVLCLLMTCHISYIEIIIDAFFFSAYMVELQRALS